MFSMNHECKVIMSSTPFDRIDKELRNDDGMSTETDYIQQTSWMLFLRYLDAMEKERKIASQLQNMNYSYILDKEFRWDSWAAPKIDGDIDYNKALTGDDLLDFVNDKLFPYLSNFKQLSTSSNTIEYKIGEIFTNLDNKAEQGYTLRNVINIMDDFSFGSQKDKHELSENYEKRIHRMGNAGRNGGEYYTPRPLIRAMIKIVEPKIGETIYDGAVGSAGFLCEAYDYLSSKPGLSTSEKKILDKETLYGQEKKGLAYIIGIMNLILHGVDSPNIIRTNTLSENIMDIQEKDRHNVILANPPFGSSTERKEIKHNFPFQTSETAYMFLQHFQKKLKANGRAAIVIKNTFLSNGDASGLREDLLRSCNLHTILDCPSGVYSAGVKTVVLFFEKGKKTRKIWYYQLNPGRNMGKTNPLNDKDMAEFLELQKSFADSDNSWTIDIDDVDSSNYDLSVKNPNINDEVVLRSPIEILDEIEKLDEESRQILKKIRELL